MTDIWIVLGGAYLIGSLPLGWVVVRGSAGVDLRQSGSGNVGAANAWRSATPAHGLLVAALDAGKGAAAVLLARRMAGPGSDPAALQAMAAAGAVLGHVAPVFLRFRGGKGVATAAGAFAWLAPASCAVAVGVFLVGVWRTRYVSLGSIAGVLALVAMAFAREPRVVGVAALVTAALIVIRHRENIERLRAGTERRLGRNA